MRGYKSFIINNFATSARANTNTYVVSVEKSTICGSCCKIFRHLAPLQIIDFKQLAQSLCIYGAKASENFTNSIKTFIRNNLQRKPAQNRHIRNLHSGAKVSGSFTI